MRPNRTPLSRNQKKNKLTEAEDIDVLLSSKYFDLVHGHGLRSKGNAVDYFSVEAKDLAKKARVEIEVNELYGFCRVLWRENRTLFSKLKVSISDFIEVLKEAEDFAQKIVDFFNGKGKSLLSYRKEEITWRLVESRKNKLSESVSPYVDSEFLKEISEYLMDDQSQTIKFKTLVQLAAAEIAAGHLLDPKTQDEDACFDSFLDFVCDHFDCNAYLEDKAAEEGIDVSDDDEYEEWFDTDHAANLSTDATDAIIYELIYSLK